MAAVSSLVALLEREVSSREELRAEVLQLVRDKHMSRKELVNAWVRLHGGNAELETECVQQGSVKGFANRLVDRVKVLEQDAVERSGCNKSSKDALPTALGLENQDLGTKEALASDDSHSVTSGVITAAQGGIHLI